MINLQTIFKNPFDSKEISDNEFKKFSEDHLARITANNPGGVLDPIIADTGAKHIGYFGAISDEDVATAVKEGLTVGMNQKLNAFKKTVQRREAAIRAAFPKDEATYQEFFPHGLTEYTNMTLENAELLMSRLTTAISTHSTELGVPLLVEVKDARAAFKSLRDTQLGKKGTVGDLKEASAATRTTLELQLVANIHFIGYTWPGNVQQCMAYFDQSFLRDTVKDKEEPPVVV